MPHDIRGDDAVASHASSNLSSGGWRGARQPEMVQVHAPAVTAGAFEVRSLRYVAAASLEQPHACGGNGGFRHPLAVAARIALDPPTVTTAMSSHESMLRSRQPYAVVESDKTFGGDEMACACGACCGKCCSGITTETKPKPSK